MATAVSVEAIESTLADLRELETGSRRGGIRTNILDLVVLCDTQEGADEMVELIGTLPYARPSRAIIALADEGKREPTFDARVFCLPTNTDGESRQVCSELITLAAGEGGAALPSLVASLLLPDLPVFLLWRARPDFGGLMADRLWPLVTRVVVDSTYQEGVLEALPQLLERQPPRIVTDLSWTKITGWRESVARAFDVPENVACLHQLSRIEIHHAGASEAQARLLAGWVMSRVGHRCEVVIAEDRREDMRSGSLTSVFLFCPEERYGVQRLDEGVGRVEAPNIPTHNLALRVPHLRELIAQELEIFDEDQMFLDALAWLPEAQDAGAA